MDFLVLQKYIITKFYWHTFWTKLIAIRCYISILFCFVYFVYFALGISFRISYIFVIVAVEFVYLLSYLTEFSSFLSVSSMRNQF